MPEQVLPIQDIAKAGVIVDAPSVSLPPNVFSDCLNIRFDDGAVRKMEGEDQQANLVITQDPADPVGTHEIVYSVFWPHPDVSPNDGYYVTIVRTHPDDGTASRDRVYLITASSLTDEIAYSEVTDNRWYNERGRKGVEALSYVPVYEDSEWQHTFFGGGRTLILNNGTSTPRYSHALGDPLLELPGWDSYLVDETLTTISWDFGSLPTDGNIDLGQALDVADTATGKLTGTQQAVVTVIPVSDAQGVEPYIINLSDLVEQPTPGFADPALDPQLAASIGFNEASGTHFLTFRASAYDTVPSSPTFGHLTQRGVENGDTISIKIRTTPEIVVQARILRAFGNLIVAGNLTECERGSTRIVRHMPGVIRTSDVAAAGSVPANWNPFRTGANTADEFTLSTTSLVQDMAELQGVLFIYTNTSIHSIQATGNLQIPFNVRPVTTSYGAQDMGSVQEFDGKHLVVGSNDIYVFSGHPSNIQSISDSRVRKKFFTELSGRVRTVLNRRQDEIWIAYSTTGTDVMDRALLWNYRDNTWTIREQTPFRSITISPMNGIDANVLLPLCAADLFIWQCDAPDVYTDQLGAGYESFVDRQHVAFTPEFDTETLASMAMFTGGTGSLSVQLAGTNTVGEPTTDTQTFSFDIIDDYKTDVRTQGRFLSYKITDDASTNFWELSGMQFSIMKGGRR